MISLKNYVIIILYTSYWITGTLILICKKNFLFFNKQVEKFYFWLIYYSHFWYSIQKKIFLINCFWYSSFRINLNYRISYTYTFLLLNFLPRWITNFTIRINLPFVIYFHFAQLFDLYAFVIIYLIPRLSLYLKISNSGTFFTLFLLASSA